MGNAVSVVVRMSERREEPIVQVKASRVPFRVHAVQLEVVLDRPHGVHEHHQVLARIAATLEVGDEGVERVGSEDRAVPLIR